jgi:hypothetical protein
MKGFLHKTEQGWQISHATYDMISERWTAGKFRLHPDDEHYSYAIEDSDWEGKQVEFEIVSDTYEKPGKGNTYAKLIPSKEQQKQLITEIMDLDAKDELYEDVKPKIDLQPMTQEEMNEIRNTAYKYFDIDDTVNDTVYTEEDMLDAFYEGWEAKNLIWKEAKKQFKESLKEFKKNQL